MTLIVYILGLLDEYDKQHPELHIVSGDARIALADYLAHALEAWKQKGTLIQNPLREGVRAYDH